jgi:hypothetical protein
MVRKVIDIGTIGNDGTGDSIRDAFRKVNDNFRELYSSLGLGERLTAINLDDFRLNANTPPYKDIGGYLGQENAILSVNEDESGIAFRQIVGESGVAIEFTPTEIKLTTEFSALVADPNPALGGDLSARSGGVQHRIIDLGTDSNPLFPIYQHEATSKGYVDTKVSLSGTEAIDPRTNRVNTAFGKMTGPLVLARDPQPDDDEVYDGLIAATKRYVDNAGFGSKVNLYVALSGQDDRPGVSPELQGRALPYAYRTLEAALKKAEELVLEGRLEIGPYKKVLTYSGGAFQCTLEEIDEAPFAGNGFVGQAFVSVDTITINNPGQNYQVGDIVRLIGGSGNQAATFEILSVGAQPGQSRGPVLTFRQLSSGVYDTIPGNTNVSSENISDPFGSNLTFNITYKVNNVIVTNPGTGYGLVSVRITGAGGTGAFGTAEVIGGEIRGITITDQGSGFTDVPNVFVSLPRFFIETGGNRTDFTGDVTTDTALAVRSRDIREGLFLRGETSGALAQILSHKGELDSRGFEIFDVDIKLGSFIEGEVIAYGDVSKEIQITVLVESGIYEENLPLRVPQNTSIVGDEFRRVIVRPKQGVSSSPWSFLYFRRDPRLGDVISPDSYIIADRLYGYHYLSDTSRPVYPLVNNKGFYRGTAELIRLNRSFLQEEIVSWIRNQIENNISPFTSSFTYKENICKRDVGLIIDSMIFDLKWGGSDRTISSALKYFGNASGRFAISADGQGQLSETVAAIRRLQALIQLVIRNVEITESYQDLVPQIIDNAFIAESGTAGSEVTISGISLTGDTVTIVTSSNHNLSEGQHIVIGGIQGTDELNGNDYYVSIIGLSSFEIYNDAGLTDPVGSFGLTPYVSGGIVSNLGGVIGELFESFIDVIEGSSAVNQPKNNDQMDMFLANDAVRWQAVTGQGHGGFMLVLDPTGQILAKSPYAQECASFSKSTGFKGFHGGMFVDGFAGNIRFKILSKDNNLFLRVGGLQRFPQLPASFIVNDEIYRINYVRDFTFNTAGSTASFVLDESTPWPFNILVYDADICDRDVGLILDGLGYDLVLGTNYNRRKAGLSYRQRNAAVVIEDQLDLTTRAIEFAHNELQTYLTGFPLAQTNVDNSKEVIIDIIRNGASFAPNIFFIDPPGVASSLAAAKTLLVLNLPYIVAETIGWIEYQIANDIAPFSTSFTYNSARCARDLEYIIQSVIYDLLYGGNSQSVDSGLKYYDGVGIDTTLQIPSGQKAASIAAIDYASSLAQLVIQDLSDTTSPGAPYTSAVRTSGTPATSAEVTVVDNLMDIIADILDNGPLSAPTIVYPNLDAYSYNVSAKSARNVILTEKANVQLATREFVADNANVYEVLMPGNRSMLSNDYTQINDLGYGVIATNGGLVEAVSMFTYYNHISYYSINGGQIRSIGGSSAHGNYALVAEGADPLEVPTPVTLFHDMAQGVECYDQPSYNNTPGGLVIWITNYSYVPLNNSELEIDHSGVIFRYPITTSQIEETLVGVAKLSLGSSEGLGIEGLFAQVPNGTKMTVRIKAEVVLTGNVVDVATRPSTGLVLKEADTVYRVLQFESYPDPAGYKNCTISVSDPAVITRTAHGLQPGYQISLRSQPTTFVASISGTTMTVTDIVAGFIDIDMVIAGPGIPDGTTVVSQISGTTGGAGDYTISESLSIISQVNLATGTLPTGIFPNEVYFVLADNFTPNSFNISATKTGAAIITTGVEIGQMQYRVERLARTTLRENYDYIELTCWPTQPFRGSPGAQACTITIGSPTQITLSSHGFSGGEVIRFETTGALPTGMLLTRQYFVKDIISTDIFTFSDSPSGTAVSTIGIQSGTQFVGEVQGLAGDDTIAVVAVSDKDEERILGTKLVWKGVEYTVVGYQSENVTLEPYGIITIDPPLVDSVINYTFPVALFSAVPRDEQGTLRIRISLTRVTSHDLLEIGTGSYSDTNYPNEIYGPSVNPFNPSQETEERGVGRVFYVTTDQFGNFNVGPFFRVDQGTGTVTFSAAIALSNLDGLGFKRGVPISEFSTDSGFTDNATDTIPTENATRTYIDRRLGLSHNGAVVPSTSLIPVFTGGFMALDGQLAMKANMNLDGNKIINLDDCTNPRDAVNLRSLTFSNFQDITLTSPTSADLLTYTGTNDNAINATVIGDITFTLDSLNNNLNAQINPDIIINADVKSDADILQSKLLMTLSTAETAAPTGTARQKQARNGISSFDSSQFNVTDGWVSLKINGIPITRIQQIGGKTVLGNETLTNNNVTAVNFTTVVNDGGAIKKNQYTSGTGFLRRIGLTSTQDSDYTVVDMATGTSSNPEGSKLVVRDSSGDFGARNVDLSRLLIDSKITIDTITGTTGGFTQYHGFLGQVGILIGDGSVGTDKRSFYDNDGHIFRTQNGLANAPITASSIQVTTITTGAVATAGTITGNWSLSSGSQLRATYADLAEYYEADGDYEPGTVMSFGGDNEITVSLISEDTKLAGIVSDNAAYIMNQNCQGNKILIALQGRVKCKVIGKISKGDLLTTSEIPGVARAVNGTAKIGTIVGKAIENYDSEEIGTIEVAVGRT